MIFLQEIVQIAWDAGAAALAHYASSHLDIRMKLDHSPVTVADLASDAVLQFKLKKILPGSVVVSEETVGSEFDLHTSVDFLNKSANCWLVDPLDGTREFLSGTDDFTVNIALVCHGKIEIGVMFAPARRLTYVGQRGKGSFKVSPSGDFELIRGRQWDLSQLRALVSRHHRGGEAKDLAEILPQCVVQPCGSALKYGYLAEGIADFALRRTPTSVWDTAAAQCILEEAGGAMWTHTGAPLEIWSTTLRNPAFLAVSDRALDAVSKEKLLRLLPDSSEASPRSSTL
jgi:3'(2'), 5'-bisphosphate nucleotidase